MGNLFLGDVPADFSTVRDASPPPAFGAHGQMIRYNMLINPRTAGGRLSPLEFFADSEKTAARIAANFAIAVQPTI